jgi:hypothetical protein
MTFRTETTHVARKEHRCDYCGDAIVSGTAYIRIAGHWNGDFYTAKGHLDCIEMWNDAYSYWADPGEGMDFNLSEACDDWQALVEWRGLYPHVICRIELSQQKSDLRWAARLLIEHSLQLDPSEYLHGNQ